MQMSTIRFVVVFTRRREKKEGDKGFFFGVLHHYCEGSTECSHITSPSDVI